MPMTRWSSSRPLLVANMTSFFGFSSQPLSPTDETAFLADPSCGGFASFEGWVRDENEGQRVNRLDYEAYVELAVSEGEKITAEAQRRFGVRQVRCIHRIGELAIGDLAVWVGVAAPHRAEAFAACRYVIDEIKHRLPIWKKEYYASGDSGWVNCERCAQPPEQHHEHHHDHHHKHSDNPNHSGDTQGQSGASDYSRQMRLPEVGAKGQAKLRSSRVLVVGAGGLGVPVLCYLAGAGIGTLGLIDHDELEASNLHRQTLYAIGDVGKPKALLAAKHLRSLNPEVDVRPHVAKADRSTINDLIDDYDIVVDCADNFATTYAVHDAARAKGKAIILASLYQYEGQLQVIQANQLGSCLRCVWQHATPDGITGTCQTAGVLGPVVGVLASLQALETIKLLLDLPGRLIDEVLLVDLVSLEMRRLKALRHPTCEPTCTRLPTAPADAAQATELSFASLLEASQAGFCLVDIREPSEVADYACPVKSLVIPMGRLLQNPDALPQEQKVLLLCARGARSKGTVQALRERGLSHVWSLLGGLDAYR